MEDCSTKVMSPGSKWKSEKDRAKLNLHCAETDNSLKIKNIVKTKIWFEILFLLLEDRLFHWTEQFH